MRWIRIRETTPSGKTQFVCRYCGRKTPAPGDCPRPPQIPEDGGPILTCKQLEQRDRNELLHPILSALVLGSEKVCTTIHELYGNGEREKAHNYLRQHREAVRHLIGSAVYKKIQTASIHDKWDVWDLLDHLREELWNK
jgi:hypothetical protein